MSLNPIERSQGLRIRSSQDLAAGLFMIGLSGLAFFLARDLSMGSLRQIGPGMLPKSFAVICASLGLLLVLSSLRIKGERLQGWSWRGVLFVLGGAVVFGLVIRGFEIGPLKIPQLGLIVAGPLVVLVAGMAAEDRKLKELVIFAVVMTTFCALLFKYALGLPIPLAPWLLGI
jgi:putative tricarboxylic transport membrane protein